jgi:hypothetical protein
MNSLDTLLIDLCVNAKNKYLLINKDSIEKQYQIDAFLWLNSGEDFEWTEVQEQMLNKNGTELFCKYLDSAGIKYNKHPRGYLEHYQEVSGFLLVNPHFDNELIHSIRFFPIETTMRMLHSMGEQFN